MRFKSLAILLLCLSFFATSCQKTDKKKLSQTDFIYLENNVFKLHGKTFFPVMLNYIPSFQVTENDEMVVAPCIDYDSVQFVEARGKEAVKQQLDGHFQLISELGFNTIRVCFDRLQQDEVGYYYAADERKFRIGNEQDEAKILNGINEFVATAAAHGLKVMPLIKAPALSQELENFTTKLLRYFQQNPTIFAYDFMNEPLYFDWVEKRDKKDAVNIVSHWRQLMTQYAPNQLFTIGFSEPIEVFEWDPSLLPVDFVEFHTYHPLRIPSEIYWYSHYVGKPWIIGETGLPADNDSISYAEQAAFMQDVYQLVRDAGGCGFGWWDFQEASDTHFEAQYTGLLNHEGRTQTADGKYTIMGTLKPAALLVKPLADYTPKAQKRPVNYYNMLGYKNIRITGTILDMRTHKPIEGAVIRGWNEWWSVGMNTFSDENGHFTLYANDLCVHFEISAPRYDKVKFDKNDIHFTSPHGGTFNVSQLSDREREYHQISFQPFLRKKDINCKSYSSFNFKAEEFSSYEWSGDMGTILLMRN